jgi:DNA polymerase elongation subunit (family B)
LYFDVIDLDFTSLYPSIIKSLNLGIETLVGRIKVPYMDTYEQNHSLDKLKERDPEEVVTVEKVNKKNYTLTQAQIKLGDLIHIIEDNNFTVSASGAMFRTDEQSVVAKILEGWFDKREYYRGLKKKAGKEEDWANYKLYDLFQHAFKILQNAMYGTFAKSGWRYTDGQLICSAAITNTGQSLTQNSIKFVNNKLNTELESDKQYICISDTDSMYIELGDLLKHRHPNSVPED